MTREEFARKIHWTRIIWLIGIVNPFIMAPQLFKMWTTMETAALSFGMLGIITFVQSGFALHGFFIRDKFVFISNVAAAMMSIATLISIPIIQLILK